MIAKFRAERMTKAAGSRDGLALVGFVCVAIGLALGSAALAWIVVGLFLVFAAGSKGAP